MADPESWKCGQRLFDHCEQAWCVVFYLHEGAKKIGVVYDDGRIKEQVSPTLFVTEEDHARRQNPLPQVPKKPKAVSVKFTGPQLRELKLLVDALTSDDFDWIFEEAKLDKKICERELKKIKEA